MADYYDKLLAGIAAGLAAGGLVGVLAPVPFYAGVALGALVGATFILDGMFRNPPLPDDGPTRAPAYDRHSAPVRDRRWFLATEADRPRFTRLPVGIVPPARRSRPAPR